MKTIKRILCGSVRIAMGAMALTSLTTSCNRAITYEDGMFDYNEIYGDDISSGDTFQLNSEMDKDDQERY